MVMLPTNQKAECRIGYYKDVLSLFESKHHRGNKVLSLERSMNGIEVPNQHHLYITSDEEIKEDDWAIEFKNNKPINVLQIKGSDFQRCIHNYEKLKKIIATTDKSLQIKYNSAYFTGYTRVGYKSLAQPSQSFIEVFIKEYNKGNVITKVMVEYDEIWNIGGVEKASDVGPHYFLKVNPKDNTITIKKLKDSWNRDEMILKLNHLYSDLTTDSNYNGVFFDNWCDKNL